MSTSRVAVALVALAVLSACTSSPNATTPPADSGSPPPHGDAGSGVSDAAPIPSCYTNPQTYIQIINACTDAQAIDKTVDLSPMNLPDGALQPLP